MCPPNQSVLRSEAKENWTCRSFIEIILANNNNNNNNIDSENYKNKK
jgi:hypothetical protein